METKLTLQDLLKGNQNNECIDRFRKIEKVQTMFEVFVDDGTSTRLLTDSYLMSLQIAAKFSHFERRIFKREIIHNMNNVVIDCCSDWLATIVIDEDDSIYSILFKSDDEKHTQNC